MQTYSPVFGLGVLLLSAAFPLFGQETGADWMAAIREKIQKSSVNLLKSLRQLLLKHRLLRKDLNPDRLCRCGLKN